MPGPFLLRLADRHLLAPLPQLEIVPVGGVNLDTAAEFIRKGAAAVGVGSSLVNQQLLDNEVSVEYLPEDQNSLWTSILVTWLDPEPGISVRGRLTRPQHGGRAARAGWGVHEGKGGGGEGG